jgi:hypothetical protein
MLPDFTDGLLPPGIHKATWREVCERFGWNLRRGRLLIGLQLARRDLRRAGCYTAWLDGSFVTSKDHPRDYDLAWEPDGVDVALLDPVLRDVCPPRWGQKVKYLGDILPNVREASSGQPFLDFFQQDIDTGRARGIVEMDLLEDE